MSGTDHNDQQSDDSNHSNVNGGHASSASKGETDPNRQSSQPSNVELQPGATASFEGPRSEIILPSSSPDDKTVISSKSRLDAGESLGLPGPLDPARLAPGDCLGHYELVEFVGGGGMGRVYRALDTKLDRFVAIKVLPGEQVADAETLQRFRNEAKSAAKLDHDNIARAFDIGEDRGLSYLVFEFIEGANIRELVERDGPLPLIDALSYTLQAADALAHAASRDVVHRDVKPSNILVTNDGRAKLIDMGLARIQTPHGSQDDLTATGVTLGTFDYISPEQARDPRIVDVRSDIYSLGCTFFYMLTGQPPFPEGTVLQKLLQHQGDEPPNIQEFRPEMPDSLSEIFRKLLAKDPSRRFQTPQELIEQLQILAAEIGLQPLELSKRSWVISRRRRMTFFERHLPWMVPIGSLIVIWLGLHIYWVNSAGLPASSSQESSRKDVYGTATAVERILPSGVGVGGDTGLPRLSSGDEAVAVLPGVADKLSHHNDEAAETTKIGVGGRRSLPPLGGVSGESDFDLENADATTDGIPEISLNTHPASSGNTAFSSATSEPQSQSPVLTPLVRKPPFVASPTDMRTLDPRIGSMEEDTGSQNELSGTTSTLPSHALAGVLVVDTLGSLPGTYATLRAACNDAKSGDVIELRYNGRREESPLSLGNIKITIRGGKNFQPVIAFRPTQSDPAKYPRDMFAMTGTHLTLLNLDIELDISKAVAADEWSMFSLGRAEKAQLHRCTLTIRNALNKPQAYHEKVAFFKMHAIAANETFFETTIPVGLSQAAEIELLDCVARGEAAFLRTEQLQPVRLTWNNGLLVTSEPMMQIVGGQHPPLPDDKVEVDLQHITAIVNGGLCRSVSGGFATYQLPIQLDCSDSIILSVSNRPLIEQTSGHGPTAEMKKFFTFNGDRNCYQGFDVFWQIAGDETASGPDIVQWSDWQVIWSPDNEKNSRWCYIDWKNPPRSSSLPHTMTPWDYALSESEENPAHNMASDGGDVGFIPQRLPLLPEETRGHIDEKDGDLHLRR